MLMIPRINDVPDIKGHHIAIFLVAYIMAFVLSAWAGYYYYNDYAMAKAPRPVITNPNFHSDLSYMDIPRISVTLPNSGAHPGIVRMDISLEVDKKYVTRLEGLRPRLTDRLISFTENLDYDQLKDPDAAAMLKPQLLEKIRESTGDMPIRDVIFRQLLVL